VSSTIRAVRRQTPRHWSWRPLKFVAHVNESTLADDTDPNFDFRYIDISSVDSEGHVDVSSELRFGDAPSRARRVVHEGDTIVSTVRTYLRSVGYVPESESALVCSTGFTTLHPRREVDSRFLYFWCRSQPFIDEVASRSVGVSYPTISPETIGLIAVPVPPKREQRAIAHLLEREALRADALIDTRRRLLNRLDERWHSLIWQATTKGLRNDPAQRASGVDWIGTVPAGWSVAPIYARCDVQLGKMLNPERAGGAYPAPYVRNVNVQWDRIDLEDLDVMSFDAEDRRKYKLDVGDLLVCEGGDVGRSAIWTGALEECFYQKAIHRVRSRGADLTRFLMYVLWAASAMDVFAVEGNRATIVHLTAEQLRRHRIPLPPPQEQREIANYLDEQSRKWKRLTSALSAQIALLQERREALVSAVFSGDLALP